MHSSNQLNISENSFSPRYKNNVPVIDVRKGPAQRELAKQWKKERNTLRHPCKRYANGISESLAEIIGLKP